MTITLKLIIEKGKFKYVLTKPKNVKITFVEFLGYMEVFKNLYIKDHEKPATDK